MRQLLSFIPAALLASLATAQAEQPALPKVEGPIAESASSHAFLSSAHLKQPIDLSKYGYIEEEYLISGDARVFGWPNGRTTPPMLATGHYTTRILVRRPKDDSKFNGTAIVEPMNPSSPVDLPIMWAESYSQFMADGYAWVGITIKPNTIKALKKFDPARYGALAMPHPSSGPTCGAKDINSWAQPTTPADETGLAWDILNEVGALLKATSADNPLSRRADRLYMTGQSQTAGYARTYATFFGLTEKAPDGHPLYDGYLYSGSPPWQVPLSQCLKGFSPGDPRLLTGPAGVPVIELFTQGDIGSNIETRRPDSDKAPDLYRRYEIAGASHVDPWEQKSFASEQDMVRASGQTNPITEADCEPKNVTPSNFPTRYVFDAAWRNLDDWVNKGVPAPHAPWLRLRPDAAKNFRPDQSFIVDRYGNAEGGIRTPYVDVPTARWIGAKSPSFQCMFEGYKYDFDQSTLKKMYPTHDAYVTKVRRDADNLMKGKWLTPTDAAAIVDEATRASIP